MKITRLDFRTINMDKVESTSQGFLRFPVFAGKTGVLIYANKDGSLRREFRSAEEAFRKKTLDSLKAIPVTNDHPENMINPENAKELSVGFGSDDVKVVDKNGNEIGSSEDFTKNGKFQKTMVTIYDAETIKDIRNGKMEVSQGYDLELDKTPGTFEDQEFDSSQKNIIFNHLAIVDKGRAGPEVRLRFDRYDAIMVKDDQQQKKPKPYKSEDGMAKLKIGDKEFEVEQEMKDAFEAQRKKEKEDAESAEKEKEDQAEEEKKKAEDRADAAERKNDRLQGRNDSLEDEVDKLKKDSKTSQKDSDEISRLVKERRDVEDVANKVLKEDDRKDLENKDVMDIKKEVIKASTNKDVSFEGKSEEYVNARFDALKDSMDLSKTSHNDASDAFKTQHEDGDKDKPNWRKSQNDSMRKDSEAYQTPLGRSLETK